LPDAVRIAVALSTLPDLDTASARRTVDAYAAERAARQGFYFTLNRMLFDAARPSERYRVLERFYALSEPLISRFYSGRSSLGDRVRLLAGRPPVPLVCAARAALIPRRVL
jgi:lycopene beta-cyclase